MAAKTNKSDGFTFDYTMKLDFNEMGLPSSLFVEAKPDGQEAVNSAIRAALDGARERGSTIKSASPQKAFSGAITEYFSKAQIKAQTKATYRSKLNHAEQFFGGSKDILSIDQADFVRYCDHVLATVTNISSQGHYITTVATFLN